MGQFDLIPEEVTRFLEGHKVKGPKLLSLLGKLYPHYHAVMETDIGKELLKKDMNRFSELWEKIFWGKASGDEVIEFAFLRDIRLGPEINHIHAYLKAVREIKEATAIGEVK